MKASGYREMSQRVDKDHALHIDESSFIPDIPYGFLNTNSLISECRVRSNPTASLGVFQNKINKYTKAIKVYL